MVNMGGILRMLLNTAFTFGKKFAILHFVPLQDVREENFRLSFELW